MATDPQFELNKKKMFGSKVYTEVIRPLLLANFKSVRTTFWHTKTTRESQQLLKTFKL